MSSSSSVKSCLASLSLTVESFQGCSNIEQEFSTIKKVYFKLILVAHPDKGGDPQVFQKVNDAFERLRHVYEQGLIGLFQKSFSSKSDKFTDGFVPSASAKPWEYYFDAQDEPIPICKMEAARSKRSACKQTTKLAKKCERTDIEKGEIRVGSMDLESGGYGRWNHLMCWRVPKKVWTGLPDPDITSDTTAFEKALESMNEVVISGWKDLSQEHKKLIIAHVMDKVHWANPREKKVTKSEKETAMPKPSSSSASKKSAPEAEKSSHNTMTYSAPITPTSLVQTPNFFEMPVVGRNNAQS